MVKGKLLKCTDRNCKSGFKSKKALNEHIISNHCNSMAHECEVCHKFLSTKQGLKEHMNIHTGDRPYKCPFVGCSESFKLESAIDPQESACSVKADG